MSAPVRRDSLPRAGRAALLRPLLFPLLLLFLAAVPSRSAGADADAARRINDQGVSAYEDGNFPLARTCFEEASRLDPAFGEPLANLGLLAFAEEDTVGAARRLVEALRLSPELPSARGGLFELIETLGAAEADTACAIDPLALVCDLAGRAGLEPIARSARDALAGHLSRLDRIDAAALPALVERALAGRAPEPAEAAALSAAHRAMDPPRRAALSAALSRLGHPEILGDPPDTPPDPVRAPAPAALSPDGAPDPAVAGDAESEEEREVREVSDLIRRGQTAQAHARIRALRAARGRSPAVVFLEAARLLKAGAKSAAAEEARAFDPAAAGSAALLVAGGALAARLGLKETARAAFDEGAARFPEEPEFPFHLALAALSAERADEACDLLARALALRPDSSRYLYFMADACDRAGRRAEAEAARARILELDPSGRYASWLRRKLGASPAERLVREASGEAALVSDEALERSGDTTPVELLERLALTRPDLQAPLRLLAERRAARGDDLGALACLLALRDRGDLRRVEPAAVADAWLSAGFPAEALEALEEAESSYPGDPYLRLKRGIALHAGGRTAEARLVWDAIGRGEDLASAALARDLLSGEAVPSVADRPDRGEALDRLARQLLGYGATATARALLERRAAEGSKPSLLLLVDLLVAERRIDPALALLDRHARERGPDRDLLVASAELCRRAGNDARGIAHLGEAERLGPLSSREQALFGDLLVRAGRNEEALVRYHRALKAGLTGLRRGEILKRAAVARAALRKEPKRGE